MRVLVVEDEERIAEFVRNGLTEHGYAVDVARDGGEALDWADIADFDVIVLDVMLPVRDGVDVCRTLRARGLRTPILMLTARDAVDDRILGLDAGADDYLVKPFELRELLARLRALARRHTNQLVDSNTLQVADLTMNTRTRRVMRGDILIHLTNKEYVVLECLMREPERVLTRTEIAESVWNYDVYNQSNVVDVYIRNLRRKIDDLFDLKLIHTVRGAGYRLSAQSEDE